MKKFVPLTLLILGTGMFVAAQQEPQPTPSLGEVARKHPQDQSANRKVWTNDDFSAAAPAPQTAEPVNEEAAGPTTPSTPDESQKTVDLSNGTKDEAKDKAKSKDPAADQEKVDTEWKAKLDAQRAKIADLKREYDLTQREYKVTATTYYADAGNRLRDQKDFADKETSYRDKINTLQKQIADEQAKLSELQDQAHKAGANKAYE